MFGIPRIHPITIHEFLNLTYLGSTPPKDVTAYQMHGSFWLEFQKKPYKIITSLAILLVPALFGDTRFFT